MTRAQRVGVTAAAAATAYLLVFFSVLKVPFLRQELADQILPVLPWWLLVSFGSYSLGSLGIGLLTFRECPDAYAGVLQDINRAKMDLRTRGVQVD